MSITKHEYDIIRHTSDNGRYVGTEHALFDLVARGLLFDHGAQALAGGAHYLTMTSSGREALNEWQRAQPKIKPTRRRATPQFEAWRTYCDAFSNIPFKDFLKTVWPNRNAY